MHKIRFQVPGPTEGTYSAPKSPFLLGGFFRGPISKEGGDGIRGRGKETICHCNVSTPFLAWREIDDDITESARLVCK